MLVYTVGLLTLTLLAALLGFQGIASGVASLACFSFVVFIFACITALLWHLFTTRPSDSPHQKNPFPR